MLAFCTCSHFILIQFALGQVGGNEYHHKGGGVNNLCLPNNPENGQHQSYDNNQVYGAQYVIGSYHKPFGWSESLGGNQVPCSVCYQKNRSTVLMVPGKQNYSILINLIFD